MNSKLSVTLIFEAMWTVFRGDYRSLLPPIVSEG
jgi:hypothetical protein